VERTISVSRTCNRPYQAVVRLIEADARQMLRGPTESAADATAKAIVELDTVWAWFDRSESVSARVGKFQTGDGVCRGSLTWEADKHKHLLPNVEGALIVGPLASNQCEMRYSGHYVPPLGVLGGIEDALVGHRIVESAIGTLLDNVVVHLHEQIPPKE
jgi:hypothetical protein